MSSYIHLFLERSGNGDLQQGKTGYSEKALPVNSGSFFYLSIFIFQERRLVSLSFSTESKYKPLLYIPSDD